MIRSLVKWPGGKSRVIPDLLPHLPKADCLVEPFVGGASVFLNTNYRRYVLADINPDLINLYRWAKDAPDLLIDLARAYFLRGSTQEDYLRLRKEFNGLKKTDTTNSAKRAALFLFLNRHGFNGVVRYNQRGGYNVPAGKHKTAPYFPETEIRLFAEKANDTNTVIVCCSFEFTLQMMLGKSEAIYCDPPYLPTSDTSNFTQYFTGPFTEENHRQLVAALQDVNQKHGLHLVISNSDTPATREIYQAFKLHEISVNRSVSANAITRGAAKEVIGTLYGHVG